MMEYNILLIEDNLEMADNISCILQLAHYRVTYASNGKEGVELAQTSLPDLILCDIMMPELDGYGVAQIIGNDPDTAGIPFIFLTAKADKNDFRLGMNFGADDYITKPFDGVDLLKVIERRIKKRDLIKTGGGNVHQDVDPYFNKSKELKEFQKFSENRPTRWFKKRDFVYMEGQSPNHLYYIEMGQVKTFKLNNFGKELITGIHLEGDFLGFVPLLENKPYHDNAEVLENSRIAIIPKLDFLALVYSSKEVARRFFQLLSNNLEEMENRLLEIAYQSVRQRVASALLKIHEKFNSTPEPVIPISRRDISHIIGTTTESLNRTLADFKEEGLIQISGDGLKIINEAKLQRIVTH